MALTDYKRSTDEKHLVQDTSVEILELFYVPYVEDEGDLSIGNGDPLKPGAVASALSGGEVKLAVYQGDGTWKIVGGSSGPTATLNNSFDFSTTSSTLDSAYPAAKTGDIVYSEDAALMWTKLDGGKWTRTNLDIV